MKISGEGAQQGGSSPAQAPLLLLPLLPLRLLLLRQHNTCWPMQIITRNVIANKCKELWQNPEMPYVVVISIRSKYEIDSNHKYEIVSMK